MQTIKLTLQGQGFIDATCIKLAGYSMINLAREMHIIRSICKYITNFK